jgi:hypothetical protein
LYLLFSESVPNHRFHIYKPSGLEKREVWEDVWELQHKEDEGKETVVINVVPPAYSSSDFIKQEHWKFRGKLDVPKERFIAYTEMPGCVGEDTYFGWAGWNSKRRLFALVDLRWILEDKKVEKADRLGLYDSAWRALLDAEQELGEEAVKRERADLVRVCSARGPYKDDVDKWGERFPLPAIPLAIRKIVDKHEIWKRGMDGVDGLEGASRGFL